MNTRRGFTLIELLVVISIIGMLASIVLVAVQGARQKGVQAAAIEFDSTNYHAMGAGADFHLNLQGGALTDDSGNYQWTFTNPGNAISSADAPYSGGSSIAFGAGSSGSDRITASPVLGSIPVGPVTLSLWVSYPSGTGANQSLLSLTNTSGSANLSISVSQNSGVAFTYPAGIHITNSLTSSAAIPANTWTLITASYDDANAAKLYINGKLAASGQVSQPVSGTWTAISIGPQADAGPAVRVSGVDVYSSAL